MAVWSTVGSVGIASAVDQNKLLLFNSVVQLGPGTGGVSKSLDVSGGVGAESLGVPALSTLGNQVTAVIRYGVDVSRDALAQGVNGIKIRFRDGDGFVVARLIAVDIDSGVESVLLGFDSRGESRSDSFRTQFNVLPGGFPPTSVHSAFYVELTLSVFQRIAVPVAFPPAVSAIELGVEGLNA
jgi:hypothetical protein